MVGIAATAGRHAGKRFAISPDGRRLALNVLRAGSGDHDVRIKQLDRAPFTLTLTFTDDSSNPYGRRTVCRCCTAPGCTGQPHSAAAVPMAPVPRRRCSKARETSSASS